MKKRITFNRGILEGDISEEPVTPAELTVVKEIFTSTQIVT